jgi:hypothetical protein
MELIPPDAPSGWWHSESCQWRWFQQHGDDPARVYGHPFTIPTLVISESQAEAFRAAFTRIGEQLRRYFDTLAVQLAPLVREMDRLERAGVLDEQPPTDPRERALWHVRRRNTGPSVRRRAPRNLDPTGSR